MSHNNEEIILVAQNNLAGCLHGLKRHGEVLVIMREMYARCVDLVGVSNERTIMIGSNMVNSLNENLLWDESKTLVRDQLLPVARRSLGADHDLTLSLSQKLAATLASDPKSTRDNRRFNPTPIRAAARATFLIPTQATTGSKPRPSCRT